MTKKLTRILSFLLIMTLAFPLLPANKAKAAEWSDDPDNRSALVVEKEQYAENTTIDKLLDQQTLHPQKTGYAALDAMLEQIIAPQRKQSISKQTKYCYDWCVKQINYSWDGYTAKNSGYAGFNLKKNPYPFNDYEADLQQAFPSEIIARTYYTMKNKKGVCYDYGVVFAVMMRYIGIDAYVHTGQYVFEKELGFSGTSHGHHGWTEVVLNNKYYIFDPQREYRFTNDGKGTVDHVRFFGVTNGSKYFSHYTEETAINRTRDAGFLSVSAHRQKFVSIDAVASRSGNVLGAKKYDITSQAALTAVPNNGKTFDGWYTYSGKLLSKNTTYTFTVTAPTVVYAMFSGDMFYDLRSQWYADAAIRAAALGLVSGTAPHYFDGNIPLTRAMAVKILANLEKPDLSTYSSVPFQDVPANTWYTKETAWAKDMGIVHGVSETIFQPNRTITREEFITLIVGYLEWKHVKLTESQLTYTDTSNISNWAVPYVSKLNQAGIIAGYPDGSLLPLNALTRAEGVTVFTRLVDYLETAEFIHPDEEENPTEEENSDTDTDTDNDHDNAADTAA